MRSANECIMDPNTLYAFVIWDLVAELNFYLTLMKILKELCKGFLHCGNLLGEVFKEIIVEDLK